MRWLALWMLLLVASGAPSADEDGLAAGEETAGHTDEEVQEARAEFADIDLNGDGQITVDEILAMQEVPEEEEITEFLETYDRNNDGAVTFDEILQADHDLREDAEESDELPVEE